MIFGYSPLDFQQFKIIALEFTGLAKDALHIYAGLGVFLLVRLLWRGRGGWIVAWLVAIAIACGAEWIDIKAEVAGNTNVSPDEEHWHDIWNTMFWPTVLLFVGPWLQPKRKISTEAADAAPELGDLADQPFEQTPPV
jgi:hypothetical protein